MSQAANTFWVNRIDPPAGANAVARRRGAARFYLDALVLMVILAASAICVSVYMRTRSEYEAVLARHKSVAERVEQLKIETERKAREVQMLKTDPEIIESCARQELGLVHPRDVVIKLAPDEEARPPEAPAAYRRATGRLTPRTSEVYTDSFQ
ncbi:MAG TPA: septum formation initiator family protein [Blastocatellia bacterium]|nr:septum formation initiator family protein [Blastocatellia bacterium]